MDLKKTNSFLVKFWLVVAILSTLYSAYYIYQFGLSGNEMYLLLPVVAFVFYGLRRSMARRLARREEHSDSTD